MRDQGVCTRACRWYALVCVVMVVCMALPARAQGDRQGAVPDDPPDSFLIDVLSFASTKPPLSRIDAFIQVGYSILSFVKVGERYSAACELAITVYDSAGGLVSEKSWTDEVKDVTFDESVSSHRALMNERSFEVPPGRYDVTVSASDRDSKIVRHLSRRITVPPYAGRPFALSDILLVGRLIESGGKRSLSPVIAGNVGNLGDTFYAFFQAYTDRALDSLRLITTVTNFKGLLQLRTDTVEPVHSGSNDVLVRLDHSSLPVGDYIMTIHALMATGVTDTVRDLLGVSTRLVSIRWSNLPRTVKDLDLAIDQLRYIAKDEEMDSLKAATTNEEKQKRFLAFWKKRDPNPNTPRNERMEQYYARVDYANRHFTHYRDGWRSDMGMIYIMFGPPSNIDRHPYEMDSKPYEVWSYYDLNYQFVFVDESGFSDYRLITPLTDIWRRRNE